MSVANTVTLGTLAAIRPHGQTRWTLGIVRRMKRHDGRSRRDRPAGDRQHAASASTSSSRARAARRRLFGRRRGDRRSTAARSTRCSSRCASARPTSPVQSLDRAGGRVPAVASACACVTREDVARRSASAACSSSSPNGCGPRSSRWTTTRRCRRWTRSSARRRSFPCIPPSAANDVMFTASWPPTATPSSTPAIAGTFRRDFNIAHACCAPLGRRSHAASRCTGRTSRARRPRYTFCDLAARGQPPVERARGARRRARRPRRDHPAAAAARRSIAHIAVLPDGRDRGAAVVPVRPRRARVPARRQRARASRSSIRNRCRTSRRCARALPRLAHVIGVAGARERGVARLGRRCSRERRRSFDAGRHARRRSGADHLHQRHHRARRRAR